MDLLTKETIYKIPKAELHCHLDGSLRPSTIIDIAKKEGVELPAYEEEKLISEVCASENMQSLEEYLEPFTITTSVLQSMESLERATFELAEDCAAENVRYLEIRFAPVLHTRKGLKLTDVVDAVLAGKRRAEAAFNITIGIIICSLRHNDPAESYMAAELAVGYKNRGIVGFDLAGAEKDYPAKDHKEAFYLIVNNNINTTVHAGEAYGPESIHQALHYISANRIGHGTRLRESGDLFNYVNDHRVPLEMCITSNIQTKAVPDWESHPVKFYMDMGLRVTLNTDNRLISNTTLTDEYMIAIERYGFRKDDVREVVLNGFKSAFLPYHEKKRMIKSVLDELEALGFAGNESYF